jgi:molecular chaperone GrpE
MKKNKKHEQEEIKQEINQVNEQLQKVTLNEVDILKSDNEKLKKQVEELNASLISKDKNIEDLTKQIAILNDEYVKKIQSKANEANALLKQKIDELTFKSQQELATYKKYAIEKQAIQLIEIINQFDLALSYPQTDPKIINFQNGFKMFLSMFKTLLNDFGINEIIINKGDDFNPEYMECIEFIDDANVGNNKIVKVLTKGYKLHDRIIKVATVVVNKKIIN